MVRLYRSQGWNGGGVLRIAKSIQNSLGVSLRAEFTEQISFAHQKPAVRFASSGVILPTSGEPIVPIEVVNLNSVIVEALRVHESNVPQFLQANRDLAGTNGDISMVPLHILSKALFRRRRRFQRQFLQLNIHFSEFFEL